MTFWSNINRRLKRLEPLSVSSFEFYVEICERIKKNDNQIVDLTIIEGRSDLPTVKW